VELIFSSHTTQVSKRSDGDGKADVFLQWKNLNLSILEKDPKKSGFCNPVMEQKKILRNINGYAKSGQLLAIMGPTGCGKTSLLNVLAGRVAKAGMAAAELTGEVLVNNRPRDDKGFRRVSAYVVQDDRLYPHLTVHETLTLAAHFFLPSSATDEEKESIVTGIIMELGLKKVRDTIIGDERVRGVSGGERKRANIAVQLISNPKVLFMDEPTSGLDSFQAQSVMEAMKAVAAAGRLVISVIHQPRSSIFKMFDDLLLLSSGQSIYFGKAAGAAAYFQTSAGLTCPPLFNPSDFYLDMLSPDFRSKAREEFTTKRISTLARNWTVTETGVLKKELENREYNGQELVPDVPTCYEEFDGQRLVRNFKLLCWRAFTEQMREVPTLVIKVTITIMVALIIGGIFQNLSYDQASVGNRVGLLFVISINQGFNAVSGVLNVFPKEKVIVNRERAANAYDTLSYFVAKYLVELPINIMPCVIFGSIVYWMVGLNPDRFGYFILILMLEAVTAVSLGLAVSAAAPNIELAQALGPLPIILSLIFGGFFINLASLPLLAEFLPYISFLKWVFQSLAINEFTDVTFECNLEPKTMCSNTGAEVLQRLTFTDTLGESVFGLAMMFLGFTVLAFILLERNFTTYIELGYVGSKFDKNAHVKYAAE